MNINEILDRINDAAKNNQEINLTVDEVRVLSKQIGHQYFIPVLTNEQVVKMVKEGKLGQRMVEKKE